MADEESKTLETEHKPVKKPSLDYVADSRENVYATVPHAAANALYLLLAIVLISLIWAFFAKLDEHTVGEGKVIASGEMKKIQNLEGGIVKQILVKEGQKVDAGQVLVVLDSTRFQSEYQENIQKLAELQADIVRLSAIAAGKDKMDVDPGFAKQHPVQVAQAQEYFDRSKAALDASLDLLNKNYGLLQKQLKIIAPLAKEGVVSNMEKLRLESQITSVQSNILDKKEQSRTTAREQLNKAQEDYAVLSEAIKASKDRAERSVIRSPSKGIVNQVYVNTIGEVVKPGDTIIDVEPTDESLTVQAYIKPSDIGFIHPKQKALVKISAYDYSIYGGLNAEVETISPNSIQDKQGKSYYEVKLKTNKNYVQGKNKKLVLIPGMTVTVSILTGQKTVLDYIIKPFIKANQSALHER